MYIKKIALAMMVLAGLVWAYLGVSNTKPKAPEVVEPHTSNNALQKNPRNTKITNDKALDSSQNHIEVAEIKPANRINKDPDQKIAQTQLKNAKKYLLTTESTLNDIVSSENGEILFNSELIEELSLWQTRDLILDLPQTINHPQTQTIMDNIISDVGEVVAALHGMRMDTVACSDSVCGVMVSSYSRDEVAVFLDEITAQPHLKESLRGGTLKMFEENGEYYGMVLGALGNTPITVK